MFKCNKKSENIQLFTNLTASIETITVIEHEKMTREKVFNKNKNSMLEIFTTFCLCVKILVEMYPLCPFLNSL